MARELIAEEFIWFLENIIMCMIFSFFALFNNNNNI